MKNRKHKSNKFFQFTYLVRTRSRLGSLLKYYAEANDWQSAWRAFLIGADKTSLLLKHVWVRTQKATKGREELWKFIAH